MCGIAFTCAMSICIQQGRNIINDIDSFIDARQQLFVYRQPPLINRILSIKKEDTL